MINSVVVRKVEASYGRHDFYSVDQESIDYLEKLIRQGFPQADVRPRLLFLASARRRCEFLEADDGQYLILDWELISTIAQMDSLALVPADPGDLGSMLVYSLFGDEFAHRANFRNYHYIFQRIHPDAGHLRSLATSCRKSPLFSRSVVFIVLHELAHAVLRKHPERYQMLDTLVDAAIQRFTSTSVQIQNDPQILQDWSHISGVSDPGTLKEGLKRDLPKYTTLIGRHADLREELKCDLAALLAHINFECGVDLFENLVPSFMPESLQKAGDCLMMGARALKGLQTVKSISAIVENIEEGYKGEFLKEPLIMATVRSNILVLLASILMESWAGQSPAREDTRIASAAQRWLDSLSKFLHRYGTRVEDSIETMEAFFADSPSIEKSIHSLEEHSSCSFTQSLDSKLAADQLRFIDLPLAKPL